MPSEERGRQEVPEHAVQRELVSVPCCSSNHAMPVPIGYRQELDHRPMTLAEYIKQPHFIDGERR